MYTPLSISTMSYESIDMDFLLGLPTINHCNDLMFFVADHFSKLVMMVSYKKFIDVPKISKLFFNHVWIYFKAPTSIVSSHDGMFSIPF
jgi:hypothetical protein